MYCLRCQILKAFIILKNATFDAPYKCKTTKNKMRTTATTTQCIIRKTLSSQPSCFRKMASDENP